MGRAGISGALGVLVDGMAVRRVPVGASSL